MKSLFATVAALVVFLLFQCTGWRQMQQIEDVATKDFEYAAVQQHALYAPSVVYQDKKPLKVDFVLPVQQRRFDDEAAVVASNKAKQATSGHVRKGSNGNRDGDDKKKGKPVMVADKQKDDAKLRHNEKASKETKESKESKESAEPKESKETQAEAECIPARPVKWEWNRYSKMKDSGYTPSKPMKKKRNTLIALFVGFDKYASMLEMTAPINKAYARKWKQDLVVLQGTSYVLPVDKGCTPQGRRTTLNKISLLKEALKHNDEYDQILILDTDAIVYDFDTDISTLLPDKYMIAAHRVLVKKDPHTVQTSNINAGVTLWNLHHNATQRITQGWHQRSKKSIEKLDFRGDQKPLQATILHDGGVPFVYSLLEEFAYGHGTVVKHFIRRKNHHNWTDPKIVDEREIMVDEAAKTICGREPGVCDNIDRVPYASL